MEELSKEKESTSLGIKVLSVLGGILASIAFLGFLAIGGLFDSGPGLLIFGTICIVAAHLINKLGLLIIDTVAISVFLIGFTLIGLGIKELNGGDNMICLSFIGIALTSLFVTRNYMLSFLSLLIINGSLISLMMVHDVYNLIHLLIILNAAAYTWIILGEASIITRFPKLIDLYEPIRAALVFSLIAELVMVGLWRFFPTDFYTVWITTAAIIVMLVLMIRKLIELLNLTKMTQKIFVYAATLLVLAPTLFTPSLAGAVLIILLSFYVNHKTGFALGILSFIYFIGQYYYDLSLTLLDKSLILMTVGVVFILVYFITNTFLSKNEAH
jgi:uncharacterized membrane protein